MTSHADRLKQHDEAFTGAQRRSDLGEMPDVGDYQALVHRFDYIEAKSNGRLYLKTELKIVGGGEFDGWPVDILNDLEDPERYEYLKTHLHRLGVDTDSFILSKIEEELPALLDVPVELNVYEGKNGQRYASINKRLGEPMRQQSGGEIPADAPASNTPPPAQDDDIPF